jgi:hypothetical protein
MKMKGTTTKKITTNDNSSSQSNILHQFLGTNSHRSFKVFGKNEYVQGKLRKLGKVKEKKVNYSPAVSNIYVIII